MSGRDGESHRQLDPELVESLKADLEDRGREYIAPAELPPAPTDPPDDVWFFRVDPPGHEAT